MKSLFSVLMLLVLLVACGKAPSNPPNQLVTVSLTVRGLGTESASELAPSAVPTGVASAEVEIYHVDGANRTLERTVAIDLTSPATDVQLLAGETHSFELSLMAADATEIAFEQIEAVVTPELVVRFEPRSIIATLQVVDAYFDGSFLIVPIQALTPANGFAAHTDYGLTITVTNGSITNQSPLGVEIIPVDASTAVTLQVEALGLLATRLEGVIQQEFSITPSSVTPGQAAMDADLTAPTATFMSAPTSMSTGSYTYLKLRGEDNRSLASIRLYENMKSVFSTSAVSGQTLKDVDYRFAPTTARTYTLHLVVTDEFGNVGTVTHRIVVE